MDRFLRYFVDLIVRPRIALRSLLGDPWRVGFGFLGHLILTIVYFIAISVALASDVSPLPQFVVLKIPENRYYFYERFFILPAGLAGTILASGAIRLTARSWGGQGRFEDLFALLGFSLIVVAVAMGLPDLVLGILGRLGILAPPGPGFTWPHVWLGTLWYVLLMILAVKEVESLSWEKSIVPALMGFAATAVVQFIFIR